MAGPQTEENYADVFYTDTRIDNLDNQVGDQEYYSRRDSRRDRRESKKKTSFIEIIFNNPAIVGALTTALVSALVTAGLEPEEAKTWGDYIVYGLILLFVGGSTGVAVRSQVKPLRKIDS